MMVLVEEERSIEEGLLELSNQSDASGCRITACVILSTFVAICGSFSFGVAIGYTSGAEIGIMKDMGLSIAENVLWLHFGRISSGIGIGLISYVVPVYIAEITPKHVRGTFTFSNQVDSLLGNPQLPKAKLIHGN